MAAYHSTRAFSVAGPVCSIALLDYLTSSDLLFDCFGHQLKNISILYILTLVLL